MDRIGFVRDIVQGILDKDYLDETQITEIAIVDYGNCIYITFTGGVSISTIVAIGSAFGDNDPNVYGEEGCAIEIVLINEKYKELNNSDQYIAEKFDEVVAS